LASVTVKYRETRFIANNENKNNYSESTKKQALKKLDYGVTDRQTDRRTYRHSDNK